MKCSKCHKVIERHSPVCPFCGTIQESQGKHAPVSLMSANDSTHGGAAAQASADSEMHRANRKLTFWLVIMRALVALYYTALVAAFGLLLWKIWGSRASLGVKVLQSILDFVLLIGWPIGGTMLKGAVEKGKLLWLVDYFQSVGVDLFGRRRRLAELETFLAEFQVTGDLQTRLMANHTILLYVNQMNDPKKKDRQAVNRKVAKVLILNERNLMAQEKGSKDKTWKEDIERLKAIE
jgi:hypothetical protein